MTEIVCDANVALKWFHDEGEEEVAASRALLDRHRDHSIVLSVLDLTFYEVGNALLRGRGAASAEQVEVVLSALRAICPVRAPGDEELALATALADEHGLTLYEAAYAAVARRCGARLATLDGALLGASLGTRPSELVTALP